MNNHITKFVLEFDGYWNENEGGDLPAEAGIYCAFAGWHDYQHAKTYPNRLLLISDCSNVRQTIKEHAHLDDLKIFLKEDEKLIYSFSPLVFGRHQAAAAMVFAHKPIANPRFKHSFPFEPTQIHLKGRTWMMQPCFTVPDDSALVGIKKIVRGANLEAAA